MNVTGATACRACGAPLDVRNLVSESGWREAPRIRDMTEIHFNSSTCQVEGEVVPVAEINLGQGDAIFFEHHVMLWKDERVPLSQGMELYNALKRQGCTTKMVIYPRTPHAVEEPRLLVDCMERNLEWFDRYVRRK